eukprot:1236366-Prymnesium_polylepis.1
MPGPASSPPQPDDEACRPGGGGGGTGPCGIWDPNGCQRLGRKVGLAASAAAAHAPREVGSLCARQLAVRRVEQGTLGDVAVDPIHGAPRLSYNARPMHVDDEWVSWRATEPGGEASDAGGASDAAAAGGGAHGQRARPGARATRRQRHCGPWGSPWVSVISVNAPFSVGLVRSSAVLQRSRLDGESCRPSACGP